mgnify:CR=1 FL=1
MKNEIDKTVERIGQLPEENCKRIWINYRTPDGTIYSNYVSFEVADLKAFATAYTQLKADLATAKQGLEHYADICSACLSPRDTHDENGQVDMLDEIGHMICGKPEYPAQQTLDKIGKE